MQIISWDRVWRVWLPLLLLVGALLFLNLGMRHYLVPDEASQHIVALEYVSLPYSESFDQPDLENVSWWRGKWRIEDGALQQYADIEKDTALVLPVIVPKAQPYALKVSTRRLESDLSSGLVFNMQSPDTLAESHLVRFYPQSEGLVVLCGYFDEGNAFREQARHTVAFAASDDAWHTIWVSVDAFAYTVRVDGEPLINWLPLHYLGGGAGLVVTNGRASFDDVLLATQDAFAGVYIVNERFEEAAEGWTFISGEWDVADGLLRQHQDVGSDLSAQFERPVTGNFLLSVELQGDGAGVLFNMPQAGSITGGHLVRFAGAGQVLMWGSFDEAGAYVGQGEQALDAAEGLRLLEIFSVEGVYSIRLDDELVARDIPLQSAAGHVGLTATEGSAVFDNFQVSVYGE